MEGVALPVAIRSFSQPWARYMPTDQMQMMDTYCSP